MTTKNIQDVVAERVAEYRSLLGNLLDESSFGEYVKSFHHTKIEQWLTTTLTQLVKEVEAGERARISKEISRRIDQWENSEEWDGTLNDGLYSLAHWIQATPPTSDVEKKHITSLTGVEDNQN